MKWPRGRYNGRRIIGISFKVQFTVNNWRWIPTIGGCQGMFHWLCFRSWTEAVYDWPSLAQQRIAIKERTGNV